MLLPQFVVGPRLSLAALKVHLAVRLVVDPTASLLFQSFSLISPSSDLFLPADRQWSTKVL